MASSTLLRDLEENFFLCSVCLDQYKEPKQLPCPHRYCRDCLQSVIQATIGGTIKCPMCKQDCDVPENGIDGFKTDFHMKSVLEFIQLQKSFEKEGLQTCMSCLKQTDVSAYCFKCRDFLCDQCYNVHVSSKMFTDHQRHTLKLDNVEAKNLTRNKLAALIENPRCQAHVNERAQLCCRSCENIPVCFACTYGDHKGHDLHNVTKLANSERKLLILKIAEVNINKSKLYEVPKNIKASTMKLNQNAAQKTDTLIHQHKQQAIKIKDKLTERKSIRDQGSKDIENRREDKDIQINLEFEKEFYKLKQKYYNIRETNNEKYDNEFETFKKECDRFESKLSQKLESLESHFKSLKMTTELLTTQNRNNLMQISDYCEQIINRYENFTATTTSILVSKDDWTGVQCIPDIRAACDPLMKEMKTEFPELQPFSDIFVSDMTNDVDDDVMITEYAESVVDVEGIKGWWITGMTSSKDGNIAIAGSVRNKYESFITVINRKGEIQLQVQIKQNRKYSTNRYCCYLSEFKIATVYWPDEIGVYNIHDVSYNKKNISDVISSWPVDRCVWCVATDPANNHIIVGTSSRDVYVFDNHLKYIHTITLPSAIIVSFDITVHGRSLLICDNLRRRAFVVNMEGSDCTLIYKFREPDFRGPDLRPISVCTDRYGFIYMMWRAGSHSYSHVLAIYSQDGQQLLKSQPVDYNAHCLALSETDENEKLLIATFKTGKLYIFGLLI